MYIIKVDPGPGWFLLDAGKKSVAAVAIDGPLNLYNPESLLTYYFYVPAGVSDFYVQVAGQGGERIKAQLINSLGVMVEEKDLEVEA